MIEPRDYILRLHRRSLVITPQSVRSWRTDAETRMTKDDAKALQREFPLAKIELAQKRTWRHNAWGNVVGYEGRTRAEEFGCHPWSRRWAMAWAAGMTREDAETHAIFNRDYHDPSRERNK